MRELNLRSLIAPLCMSLLCKLTGGISPAVNDVRYVLTESSRYCPSEDHGGYDSPPFDWQNPFTAYNCTWGFHAPTPFPTRYTCSLPDATSLTESSSPQAGGIG